MSEAVHRVPIWRDRSNFIIAIEVDPADTDVTTEQLWARKVDERHFELCCIPFFAYDIALGDVLEVDADFMVRRVSTASGRYVFRVYFERGNYGNRDSSRLPARAREGAAPHVRDREDFLTSVRRP